LAIFWRFFQVSIQRVTAIFVPDDDRITKSAVAAVVRLDITDATAFCRKYRALAWHRTPFAGPHINSAVELIWESFGTIKAGVGLTYPGIPD
jgi:hypothetical protein